MYDERSLQLFAAAKAICDPDNLLNPGVLVDPAPLDADLRPARPRAPVRTALRLTHDGGSLADAVHRCTGVGKCVAPAPGGVMCPSWVATREEKDSTRGRARVLQEALDGSLVQGLADPAVHDALDLCLACKGCASDCPTGVDMGAYKAEVLHQAYAGKRRPRSHYTLGRLPSWVRRLGPLAGVANRTMRGPAARLVKAVAGIDERRSLPELAPVTLRQLRRTARPRRPTCGSGPTRSPTTSCRRRPAPRRRSSRPPGSGSGVIPDDACCGLTWITTGQLDRARRDRREDGRHPGAVRHLRRPRRRPRALLPGHAAHRRRRADRRPAGGRRRGRCAHPRRGARARSTGSRRTSPGSRWSRSRTATTPPCSAGRPTSDC